MSALGKAWKRSAKDWREEAAQAQQREAVALADCRMWREQFACAFDELQRVAPGTNFAKLLFDARERQKHYDSAGEFIAPKISTPTDTRATASANPGRPAAQLGLF